MASFEVIEEEMEMMRIVMNETQAAWLRFVGGALLPGLQCAYR